MPNLTPEQSLYLLSFVTWLVMAILYKVAGSENVGVEIPNEMKLWVAVIAAWLLSGLLPGFHVPPGGGLVAGAGATWIDQFARNAVKWKKTKGGPNV